jgi:hypothetical protein
MPGNANMLKWQKYPGMGAMDAKKGGRRLKTLTICLCEVNSQTIQGRHFIFYIT